VLLHCFPDPVVIEFRSGLLGDHISCKENFEVWNAKMLLNGSNGNFYKVVQIMHSRSKVEYLYNTYAQNFLGNLPVKEF